ncbi:hypothetical protein F5Y12DRAFT_577965 [Xylaria sp. FL1777]|nr:hypothetical protein F5Y12DRAFT_577965 [Xylaria sp. FL1777]
MSLKQTSPILKAWYQWKSLRLPWRKRFLVGRDPQGNTYYELRQPRGDAPESAPYRRLVHYPRSTPYSEVKVPPAWHQWLRHQRIDAPSMAEQVSELQRQARMKILAAEADARWEAKPSVLDMPPTKTANRLPGSDERASKSDRQTRGAADEDEVEIQEAIREDALAHPGKTSSPQTKPIADPWKRPQTGVPGETWQPQAWTPTPTPAGKR